MRNVICCLSVLLAFASLNHSALTFAQEPATPPVTETPEPEISTVLEKWDRLIYVPFRDLKKVFDNQDAGIPHNVAIHEGSVTSVGKELYAGAIFPGIAQQTYDIPAFNAGNYVFICTVHPNMIGTLKVGG